MPRFIPILQDKPTDEAFRAAALIEQRDRIARTETERIAREAYAKARDDAWAAEMDKRWAQAERERQARERDPRHIAKVKNQNSEPSMVWTSSSRAIRN